MTEPDQELGGHPPDDLIAAVKDAFGQRLSQDVATLVFDSLIDTYDPPQGHLLRFEHARMNVDLALSTEPEGNSMAGHVQGERPARVRLHVYGSDTTVVADLKDRSFLFGDVPHGLVRLSLENDRDPLWTDWFRI